MLPHPPVFLRAHPVTSSVAFVAYGRRGLRNNHQTAKTR